MSDIFTVPQRNSFAALLADSGYCASPVDREALLIRIGLSPQDYQFHEGAANTFAVRLIYDLEQRDNREALKEIIRQMPMQTEREALVLELRQILDQPQNVHILTSVKGGVGKTLTGLGVTCNYHSQRRYDKTLVAADMNTMNPDLFRILSALCECEPGPTPFDNWQQVQLPGGMVQAVRPNAPYVLPKGAAGFWRGLSEVLAGFQNLNCDVIVDTNLHVSNLVSGDQESINLINQILRRRDRTIYIWIFWTWAAFRDSDPVTNALGILDGSFGQRVSVVHVLNPSALMPPQIDLTAKEKIAVSIDNFVKGIAELLTLMDKDRRSEWRKVSDLLKQAADIDLDEMGPELYRIAGLKDLADPNLAPVQPPISYLDFSQTVTRFYRELPENTPADSAFEPLYDIFTQNFGGRPSNVFPISTHDPNLIGYTEYFARRSPKVIEDVQRHIQSIENDLNFYFEYLSPAKHR
jgi:hypothetical protein